MSLPTTFAPEHQRFATGLGVATLGCGVLLVLSAFLVGSVTEGTSENLPPVLPSIIVVCGYLIAFPLALLFTVVAVVHVGFARCKLAWVSFCPFLLPLVVLPWFCWLAVIALTLGFVPLARGISRRTSDASSSGHKHAEYDY